MQVQLRPSGRRKRRDKWRDSRPNHFNPKERELHPLLRLVRDCVDPSFSACSEARYISI